eukprot:4583392-Prymnesium_polylepis.1
MHRLLRDVREAQVGVLPRLADALLALQVADEQLEERRLARAVAADDDGARAERERGRDGVEQQLVHRGVFEVNFLEREDRLAEGSDALGLARVGEDEGADEAGVDHLLHLADGRLQHDARAL